MKIVKTLKAAHFIDNYLINPTNPVTFNLIGAGGTGSAMLTALARMNHALVALRHPGIQVNLFDNDRISEPNPGRQLFSPAEVGLFKSVALINRTNRFFGTNWKAVNAAFNMQTVEEYPDQAKASVYISCVDKVKARYEIAKIVSSIRKESGFVRDKPLYWMDCGNGESTGQVILSTIGEVKQPVSKQFKTVASLPMVTDEFGYLLDQSDVDDKPSCSMAEALESQDLFINSFIANYGATLLWRAFRKGMTFERGAFVNLDKLSTQAIKIAA